MKLVPLVRRLSRDVDALGPFEAPVAFVYNPLAYARRPVEAYLEKFARRGTTLLVGMNPGPFGMAQTGVPFGEVAAVRDWLRITESIDIPHSTEQHPKRPIEGLECARSEVSGRRLWAWAEERYGTPGRFFQRFFVWNWCPLAFMEESGRNVTPDKLARSDRERLLPLCTDALTAIGEELRPVRVIGIGAAAQSWAQSSFPDLEVGRILHPSPASPIANRGWAPQAEKQLAELGVEL